LPTLPDFFRSTPPASLRDYFTAVSVALPPDFHWDHPANDIVVPLLRAVDAMDDLARLRVMNDADRVGAMADEPGQAALYSITGSTETLDSLENGHARALWMFLKDPAGFGHAEEVRYADDRRYGRMWDGFECLPGLTVPRDGDPYTAFKAAIATHFDTKHVEVEICDRSRPSLDGEHAELIQVAIYREGRAGDRRAFVNGKLDRLPFRPVVEAAITYEPASGTIEVVAQARETREDLVRLFAEHMLGAPFDGDRIPIRFPARCRGQHRIREGHAAAADALRDAGRARDAGMHAGCGAQHLADGRDALWRQRSAGRRLQGHAGPLHHQVPRDAGGARRSHAAGHDLDAEGLRFEGPHRPRTPGR
jgi:hypothetical protein